MSDQVGATAGLPASTDSSLALNIRRAGNSMRRVRNGLPRRVLLLLTVTNLAFSTGCGPQHPPTYPVSGKVVFADGAPLTTGGVVLCESVADGGLSINARGAISDDGTFALTTFDDGDGAIAGKHRVLVRAKRDAADYLERGIIPRPVIDPRFESYETSGLESTVAEGNNEWTLVVERPPVQ